MGTGGWWGWEVESREIVSRDEEGWDEVRQRGSEG